MPAIPSQLTSLDFFEIKESIKSYLRTRDEFSDYDFEGSTAAYLLDILAYNTYYSAFNANMAINELFLESATIRDNVVRIAKQLNYTPRSIKAARACISLKIQAVRLGNNNLYPNTITLKKGDVFSSRNVADSFTFALMNDVTATVDQATGIADFSKLIIYQGNLLTINFTVDDTAKPNYIIPTENVDTERMSVTVKPNQQSTESDTYTPVGYVTNLDGNSRVYYLEETDDLRYKVIFGDGVLGRKLIDGEYITISYLRTSGRESNGCSKFSYVGTAVDSEGRAIPVANIQIVTVDSAQDGEDRESALSIKYNAPRAYSTQNRAVTEADYEYLTSTIYEQAASVVAYGGEKLNPPVYGKVFIGIRTKSGAKLNQTTKTRIKNELRKYSMASIDPEVVDPTTYYIVPRSTALYDSTRTNLANSDIKNQILSAIDKYNASGLEDRFGGRFEGSKLGAVIDGANDAISGNVVQLSIGQNLDQFNFGNDFTQCLNYGNPIYNSGDFSGTSPTGGGNNGGGDGDGNGNGSGGTPTGCDPVFSTVKSGQFYVTGVTETVADRISGANGTTGLLTTNSATVSSDSEVLVPVNIRDNGRGGLILVTERNEQEVVIRDDVGSVDYNTGEVCVGPLNIAKTPDDTPRIPVIAIPESPSIEIPAGVDPTIFNPDINVLDITNPGDGGTVSPPGFTPTDPNTFNFGNINNTLNIISYPQDTFEYPEIDSCF